jgi:hypothetical protein
MKISYRTHPILEKLHKGDLGKLPLLRTDYEFPQIEDLFKRTWNEHKIKFAQNITYITKPFAEAANKTYDKMSDLFIDMLNNGEQYELSGTFIQSNYVFMIDFKAVSPDATHPDNSINVFVFLKEGEPLYWFSEKYGRLNGWLSNEIINGNILGKTISTNQEIEKLNHFTVFKLILFSMFKTFAEVETKMLPAGKKIQEIDCKYVNDTKLNILHLDSKWFTNLVKSEGFNVRGHFRLQAYGKGLNDRKLIWINSFSKTGYTAPARKLSENNL